MNIMISWCSFDNRIVQILKSIVAVSREEMIWHSKKGKCNAQVMDKCTNLRAADNGAATRPQVRANDMRTESRVFKMKAKKDWKLNLLLPLLLDFSA